MIVYKLVFAFPAGQLASFWASYCAKCSYRVGGVTKPPSYLRKAGYSLFAFATLEDARAFHGDPDHYTKIYEAEATGVRTENLPPPLYDRGYSHGYVDTDDAPEMNGLLGSWPQGTVMCDTIKLIREVK